MQEGKSFHFIEGGKALSQKEKILLLLTWQKHCVMNI